MNVDQKIHTNLLTIGSFAIVAEIPFLWLHSYASFIPHLVDLRHAEFGVLTEE